MTTPQTYNAPGLHRNVDFRDKRWDLCFLFLVKKVHVILHVVTMMFINLMLSVFTVRVKLHYRGGDTSLARPTSRYILFDGENFSFDASLVICIYIYSTNIPPIMIINRTYEHQNLLSL
jgi:hypothetical protein